MEVSTMKVSNYSAKNSCSSGPKESRAGLLRVQLTGLRKDAHGLRAPVNESGYLQAVRYGKDTCGSEAGGERDRRVG
jgi:hypothetical protein